jgi:hypothetical protein
MRSGSHNMSYVHPRGDIEQGLYSLVLTCILQFYSFTNNENAASFSCNAEIAMILVAQFGKFMSCVFC